MALTKWRRPTLRQEIADHGHVTWLELFFDLIYVAALIQLGDQLAGDVSWSGVGRFAGAFVILWWTWTGTTAFMNRFAVDDVIHRALTFVQMFAVGNFAIIATTADTDRATWLAVAYIAARIPLLLMYLRVRTGLSESRALTNLYLGAFGASAAVWALSLLVPTPARYWLWAGALAMEFVAPVIGARRADAPAAHNEHFQERYALFTIIVLGETFVKTISEVTDIGVSLQTQVFGSLAFLMLIALWWTYFDDVAESVIRPSSPLSGRSSTNGLVWVYAHLPLTAAITAFGVSSKKVIGVEAFSDSFKDTYAWLLAGALIAILVSVAVLDAVTASPHFSIEPPARIGGRLIAAVVLVPLAALTAAGSFGALLGISLISGVVVAQIAVEVIAATRSEHRLEARMAHELAAVEGECTHLDAAAAPDLAAAELTCHACDEHGVPWVQLRLCLDCGHIGCCDDSPGGHARKHHQDSGHAVIATLEDGDDWAFCFVHEALDPHWQRSEVADA